MSFLWVRNGPVTGEQEVEKSEGGGEIEAGMNEQGVGKSEGAVEGSRGLMVRGP